MYKITKPPKIDVLKLTKFVEVEREFAGDGTVEPRFEERRPDIAEKLSAALVVLTYPRYSRKHRLQ